MTRARMVTGMNVDQRQQCIRNLKESSSLLNTAADLLLLVSDSPEEKTAAIIVDLVQRARDLIDGAALLENNP